MLPIPKACIDYYISELAKARVDVDSMTGITGNGDISSLVGSGTSDVDEGEARPLRLTEATRARRFGRASGGPSRRFGSAGADPQGFVQSFRRPSNSRASAYEFFNFKPDELRGRVDTSADRTCSDKCKVCISIWAYVRACKELNQRRYGEDGPRVLRDRVVTLSCKEEGQLTLIKEHVDMARARMLSSRYARVTLVRIGTHEQFKLAIELLLEGRDKDKAEGGVVSFSNGRVGFTLKDLEDFAYHNN
jgi:hypothetical protein